MEFFDESWPEARAVSDPDGRLFEGMKVNRVSLRQMFGPGVWVRAVQAWRKGYRGRFPIGNPWLLPGIFLVRRTEVLWKWRFENIGDHPEFSRIPHFSGLAGSTRD
ncbi:MAG: AhpC/TSA family protein [Acidobacteriota bacterium]|nr:MAG: AhpC/TSA family protein [Acidobacteriota bacterium]